ncbi:hypothetical protein BGW41_001620 [Actinomortierella wolfii]|nr:hypothetical protein BGW41_001620 [Actinomortierella wolfii]
MPQLPHEVLSMICRYIDNAHGLASCLTLNKAFFTAAAEELYRHPLRFFASLTPDGKRSLLRWLLSLSPTDDPMANELRAYLQVSRRPFQHGCSIGHSSITTPYMDYLSLVRIFQWPPESGTCFTDLFPQLRLHAQSRGLEQIVYHMYVREALLWAVCGNSDQQLGRLTGIEIEAFRMSEFASRLSKFSDLKSLIIRDDIQDDPVARYEDALHILLERCHQLVEIICMFNSDNSSSYAWISEMAQRRIHGPTSHLRQRQHPAPSPQVLNLYLQGFHDRSDLPMVEDALKAFGLTLQRLEVHVRPNAGVTHSFVIPTEMIMLREVWLVHDDCFDIDLRPLEKSPIQQLSIEFHGVVEPTAGEDAPPCPRQWPVLRMQHLTQLKLTAVATRLFDPTSLHHMPMLKELILVIYDESRMKSNGEADQLHDSVLGSETSLATDRRWTWDWPLPNLRLFSLATGYPYMYRGRNHSGCQSSFNFRLLQTCPRLETIHLRFETPPLNLWDTPRTDQILQHPSNALNDPQTQQEQQQQEQQQQPEILPTEFPSTLNGLTRLDMAMPFGFETIMLASTRDHPTLREVVSLETFRLSYDTENDNMQDFNASRPRPAQGMVQLKDVLKMLEVNKTAVTHNEDISVSDGQNSLSDFCFYEIGNDRL